jgi:hypothetical protein
MLNKMCWMRICAVLALLLAVLPGVSDAQGTATTRPGAAAAKPEPGKAAAPAKPGEAVPAVAEPVVPMAIPPAPYEVEVFDIPDDDGTNLGVLFKWAGATGPDTTVTIKAQVSQDQLKNCTVSETDRKRLDDALTQLENDLAPLLLARDGTNSDGIKAQVDAAKAEYDLAKNNKSPDMLQLCRAYFAKEVELEKITRAIDAANDRFASRTTCSGVVKDLRTKARMFDYLQATINSQQWLTTDVEGKKAADLETKGDHPELFGHDPDEADKLFIQIDQIQAMNPAVLDGTYQPGVKDKTDLDTPPSVLVQLLKNHVYELQMVVQQSPDDPGAMYDLGGAKTQVNYFKVSLLNNFVFAVLFSIVILAAIMMARRNPNMFIRRIQGLEAVDEAIGRATEMGKPVLYLCGIDPLASLATLAAINLLSRVARRVADYDSELIVPCKDPVVMTVAQEVVKEAYIDQGRPDAYREDNIFFLTDDQFAYTAATCGIMMREKPAANFFMGYYAAEALLLAETGAATGAIQIAGTDSTNQLPFFITACDYTLIGEELYAASAYLSREPLLLGSLKGQDVGKALVMILIIVQTLLFVAQLILQKNGIDVPLDFLKNLVQPL